MAKVVFEPANPEGAASLGNYRIGELTFHSATKAVFVDNDGFQFILTGKGFTYNGLDLIGGTITGAAEKDDSGTPTTTITGLNVKPKELEDTDGLLWPYRSQEVLLKEDDKIIGSNAGNQMEGHAGNDHLLGKGGNDVLFGSRGRDELTGGRGNDAFHFYVGDGRDTITDFKARGDDDIVHLQAATYEMRNTKAGVLVVADNGQEILFEGLKKADLETSDFLLI